jgi:uncharacterized protein (TIGR03437 family)
MKRLGVLVLAANSLFAADFVNGQAARAVIGQPDFTFQFPGPPTDTYPGNMILGAASGLAYANGMLVVADSSVFRAGADPQNNRVLIYRQIFGTGSNSVGPTQLPPATAEPPANTFTYWWCPVCGGAADVVLGQTDFNGNNPGTGSSGLRTPSAVATDGVRLAVADTDNNRVLLWNSIPAANGQPADVVLGQPDFVTVGPNSGTGNVLTPSASTLRGPEGVWIQNGKLFVADSMNNRVLIWNSWPSTNGQAADVVLGQPNFTTQVQGDLTKGTPPPTATNMLNPASVTSDGTRLYVADLGQNRVLIWNTIPTENQAAANVALGQPNLTSGAPNNAFTVDSTGVETPVLCQDPSGTDSNGHSIYPYMCESTLSFPRYALSDGNWLFVADGGNDRVLVFKSIPTESGAKADRVLGQRDFLADTITDPTDVLTPSRIGFADGIRTPSSLAWDGTNLFVSDPFTRRVVVFTVGSSPILSVPRNAASMEVFATAMITLSGTPTAGDQITATVQGVAYTYPVVSGDTLSTAATGLAGAINAGSGDPNVIATALPANNAVMILARVGGVAGNSIVLATSVSSGSGTSVTSTLMRGGSDASAVAPATLVAIFGQNLSADPDPMSAPLDGGPLPTRLGSVQVYADGIPCPLLYTSKTQINAQIPFEVAPATGISVYTRITDPNTGNVTIANAAALPVVTGNPGIFARSIADDGTTILHDPRPAYAVHSSSHAMGGIDLELSAVNPAVGDTVTVTIGSNSYVYTVPSTTTTLDNIRDGLIDLINNQDPNVTASAAGQWDRLVLLSKTEGPAGNGLAYSVTTNTGGTVTAAAYGSELCCANTKGAPVTADNPAVPGEIITFYATGLGLTSPTPGDGFVTGAPYDGVFPNRVADFTNDFVSGTFGGATAQILNAALLPGTVGLYEVDILLSSTLTTNAATQGYIVQRLNYSNIVTIPVRAPE